MLFGFFVYLRNFTWITKHIQIHAHTHIRYNGSSINTEKKQMKCDMPLCVYYTSRRLWQAITTEFFLLLILLLFFFAHFFAFVVRFIETIAEDTERSENPMTHRFSMWLTRERQRYKVISDSFAETDRLDDWRQQRMPIPTKQVNIIDAFRIVAESTRGLRWNERDTKNLGEFVIFCIRKLNYFE